MNQEQLQKHFTFTEEEYTQKTTGRPAKGRLIRKKNGKPVGATPNGSNGSGHLMFTCLGKNVMLHRAIWIYHKGPIQPGLSIRHLNDDPFDNRLENLMPGTQLENGGDRRKYTVRQKESGLWEARTTVSCCHVRGSGISQEKAFEQCEQKVKKILDTIAQSGHKYFRHSPEELRKMLTFEPETNTFLVKETPKACLSYSVNRLVPGRRIVATQEWIFLQGQMYAVCELVYLLFHGPIKANKTVHHIDYNHKNNRPENLVLVDREKNSQLGSGPNRFKSVEEFSGVRWFPKFARFGVSVKTQSGKNVWLGAFKTEDEARAVAREAHKQVISGEFVEPSVHVEAFLREQFGETEIQCTSLHQKYLTWCKNHAVPSNLQRKRPKGFFNVVTSFSFVALERRKSRAWFVFKWSEVSTEEAGKIG